MLTHRIARSAVSVLVFSATLLLPVGRVDATSNTIEGFTTSQRELIHWAIGLFDEAGLELPAIDFEHHSTRAPCRGAKGLFIGTGLRATVRICVAETGPFAETLYLHEIAHAWDGAALGERRRSAFLSLRGLDQWWNDGSSPWHTYAAEQAAVVMVWGLIDRPLHVAMIPNNSCEELRTAYMTLTGHEPRHGFTDECAQLP